MSISSTTKNILVECGLSKVSCLFSEPTSAHKCRVKKNVFQIIAPALSQCVDLRHCMRLFSSFTLPPQDQYTYLKIREFGNLLYGNCCWTVLLFGYLSICPLSLVTVIIKLYKNKFKNYYFYYCCFCCSLTTFTKNIP